MSDSPSAPPAPDYVGAAQATAAGNLANTQATVDANRVNQVTPYGSITYTQAPATAGTLDQSSYDAAQNKYNADLAAYNASLESAPSASGGAVNLGGNDPFNLTGNPGFSPSPSSPSMPAPVAPNQADYMTGGTTAGTAPWTMTQTLSPEQQKLFDQNQQTNQTLGNIAQTGLGFVQDSMNAPLSSRIPLVSSAGANNSNFITDVGQGNLQTDIGNAGNIQKNVQDPNLLQQQVVDALYKQNTQYLDPQFQQSGNALANQLANQGITQGSEAYNNAMLNAANQKQQAYESARNSSIAGGVQAAQALNGQQIASGQFANQAQGQQYTQNANNAGFYNQAQGQKFTQDLSNANLNNQAQQGLYGQKLSDAQLNNQASAQDLAQNQAIMQNPINMTNAVRTGEQMQVAQLPQPMTYPLQGNTLGPDYLGAAQGQNQYNMGLYNSQVGQNNANLGAATTVASAAAMAY